MLAFLNFFFILFHSALILFNMLGWMFRKTRKWSMLSLGLTACSWFILGIWYGWGYCPCTDWHWEVRRAMMLPVNYSSFIQYMTNDWFHLDWSSDFSDAVTLSVFLLAILLNSLLLIRDRKQLK